MTLSMIADWRYNHLFRFRNITWTPIRKREKTSTLQDELLLLAGVRKLDPEALTEVHDTYYPAIFRYIAFRVGDRTVAEDLTSEVFTRLLSAVRDRHAPQRTLRGWLYGVASRVVNDHFRQRYRRQDVALNESLASETGDPVEQVSTQQTFERLYGAVKELTDEQQEVIALRFGYDMPIREVAQTMGKSEGAVKQLQARAVAALTRRLVGERKNG
jgi:RNA polymerase sigma-70 factor (ECF subfamily)